MAYLPVFVGSAVKALHVIVLALITSNHWGYPRDCRAKTATIKSHLDHRCLGRCSGWLRRSRACNSWTQRKPAEGWSLPGTRCRPGAPRGRLAYDL